MPLSDEQLKEKLLPCFTADDLVDGLHTFFDYNDKDYDGPKPELQQYVDALKTKYPQLYFYINDLMAKAKNTVNVDGKKPDYAVWLMAMGFINIIYAMERTVLNERETKL